MSSELGFIKLERGIVDHWVFTKDPEFRIWVYLIFLAKFSNSQKPVVIGKQQRVLDRGEFVTSIGKIAAKHNQSTINHLLRCNILIKRIMQIKK